MNREDLEAHHSERSRDHLRLLNASQLYHTTGVTAGSDHSEYELPAPLWNTVCEDGTNVPWSEVPGCEGSSGESVEVVGAEGRDVSLWEKVGRLEEKNKKLELDNTAMLKEMERMKRASEQFKQDVHDKHLEIQDIVGRERHEHVRLLEKTIEDVKVENKRLFNEYRKNMEVEAKKTNETLKQCQDNNNRQQGQIQKLINDMEKAAHPDNVIEERKICPCSWTVKLVKGIKLVTSPNIFYTADGYAMAFRADWRTTMKFLVGALLHKGDDDDRVEWPYKGDEVLTVRDAATGEKVGEGTVYPIESRSRKRPTNADGGNGHFLTDLWLDADMENKVLKLTMQKK